MGSGELLNHGEAAATAATRSPLPSMVSAHTPSSAAPPRRPSPIRPGKPGDPDNQVFASCGSGTHGSGDMGIRDLGLRRIPGHQGNWVGGRGADGSGLKLAGWRRDGGVAGSGTEVEDSRDGGGRRSGDGDSD